MFEIVSLDTDFGRFHGLFAKSDHATGLAIHIHGTGGNFYGNTIATAFASVYTRHGFNYATLNVPGYDATAATERLSQFAPVLEKWITKLAPTGELVLQGHSLGALKIINLLVAGNSFLNSRITRAVLMSPFDIVSFYLGKTDGEIAEKVEILKEWQRKHGDDYLVPKSFFEWWPISVGTLLDLATPGSPCDVFPSRMNLSGTPVTKLPRPALVFIGGNDFASFPTPRHVATNIAESSAFKVHEVSDAAHNLEPQINTVADHLDRWLSASV